MSGLLDRVDENDRVIGTTTREEAHEKGYAHRVAAVFVFDDENNLIVQLRKDDGLLDNSAAGHVDPGETYEAAALRETKEELGLATPLSPIGIFYSDERILTRKTNTVHYFGLYETKPGNAAISKIIPAKDEVLEIFRMKLEDIAGLMLKEPMRFTPGFINTLNFYSRKKNLKLPDVPIL